MDEPGAESRRHAVSIYEVARHARVSAATVSRMLNGSGYVSAAARERIQAAVHQLRYEPNTLARSLRTRHTGMLALVLTDIINPFSAQVARGVQDGAQAAGYVPIICSIDDDARNEVKTVRLLRSKRVDGIILTPTQGEQHAENTRILHHLCEQGMAIVCMGRHPVHPRIDEISTDTAGGAEEAIAHLATLGHRRIAFIGGRFSRGVAAGRLAGYRRGLCAAGLPVDETLVREGDLDEESGHRETLFLLSRAYPPTAVFCVNDRTALGALTGAAAAGYRVPDDLSVVGFDDTPLASLCGPPLTTVRQPARELGSLAVQLLLTRIAHPDHPQQRRMLSCQLVERRSSGPAPAPAALVCPLASHGDAAGVGERR
jgi:DNA-binding LacI/PurR family transcriptional regulator